MVNFCERCSNIPLKVMVDEDGKFTDKGIEELRKYEKCCECDPKRLCDE